MREVELFKKGTAQTLIPLSALIAELRVSSPVADYARAAMSISQQEDTGTQVFFLRK